AAHRTALGRTNRHAISTGAIPTAVPVAMPALPSRGLFGGMFQQPEYGAPPVAHFGQAAQGHAEPVLVPAGFAPAPVRVLPPSPAFSRAHATPDMAFSPEAPGPVRALGGHSGWVVEEVIDFEDVQEFYGEDLEFPDCAVHPAISEECGVPRIRECLRDGLAEARCLPGGLLGRCYEMCTVWEDVEEES
ncbi:unnamed protein product, partial [Prorocentrum cordatum]